MRSLPVLLFCLAVAATPASATTINLITNGDFSDGLNGWDVTSGTVDVWNGSFYVDQFETIATDAQRANSYGLFGPGSEILLRKEFSTLLGTSYSFSFDVVGIGSGIEKLEYVFGGSPNEVMVEGSNDLGNVRTIFGTFSGTGIFTELFFVNTGNSLVDVMIDNVVVSAVRSEPPVPAVPEPASWAMMIGGFGLAGASLRRRRAAVA